MLNMYRIFIVVMLNAHQYQLSTHCRLSEVLRLLETLHVRACELDNELFSHGLSMA